MPKSNSFFKRQLMYSGMVLSALFVLGAPSFTRAQSSQPVTPPAGTNASQPAATNPSEIGEVIVTANRQSQTLQKTAASVTVLTAEALETAGVRTTQDLDKLIPNFTFNDFYRAGVPFITARGIPTVQGGEAPVAFVVDGAQAAGLDFVNQDLMDIQDVQVLLGPQGALYGRGAIGGAVVVTTRQPTDDFHESFDATYGNGDLGRVINTLSGPIIPGKFWASLTLEDETFGGLIKDPGTGKPADWSREQAGRLELLYTPTDSTTLAFTYSRTQGLDGASYFTGLTNAQTYDYSLYHSDRNLDTSDNRYIDTGVLRADQVTPYGTFTSISQFAQEHSTVFGDSDFSPAPLEVQFNPIRVQAFNEDVRFTSPTGTSIQWLVGAFFQYRDTRNFLNIYGEPGGPDAGMQFSLENEDSKSLAYAGYGQISYDGPSGLKIVGALRYDVDSRYDNDETVPGTAIRATFSAVQPSGTISKQWTPNLMTYATVGRGFRSGGFNGYEDANIDPAIVRRMYPAETDVNYEIGVKSQWLDRKLTINADFFHTDYSNEQYFLVQAFPLARDIVSIKSVSINGGELSVRYAPVHGLSFGEDIGVAYSRINSNDGYGDQGKYSPDAPLYTANTNFDYKVPAFAGYLYAFHVDYDYKGPVYYGPVNTVDFHPVGFLNLRLGLESKSYSFSAWAKNATNTREPVFLGPSNFGAGVNAVIPNEPASYGVEFRFKM